MSRQLKRFDSFLFEAWLDEPNWTTLKSYSCTGKIAFEYQEMVRFSHLDSLGNVGRINKVCVYPGFMLCISIVCDLPAACIFAA